MARIRSDWGPAARTKRTGAWWKFLVAGPCLIALVIVPAGAGVDAWFLGIGIVLLGVASIVMGLVLGVAQVWNRRVSGSPA